MGPRGLANAIKKALIQGIGWNLMKLIAHLTGLRPRGWSQSAPASLGAALASLCALFAASVHYVSAVGVHIHQSWVRITIGLRLWLPHHQYQPQSLTRKCLLSRGC
jgi:hypothetical protein